MNKGAFYVSCNLSNKIFDISNVNINRDNFAYFYYELKREFSKGGYDLSTQDINHVNESGFIIYHDIPKSLPTESNIHKSYLLILEPLIIKPENWDLNKHKNFKKIFTWDDNLVDNKKYFKINYSYLLPNNINKDITIKNKLCVLISGNKYTKHPLELYSKRIEAIRWFENNHPEDFDLYGVKWNKLKFHSLYFNYKFNKKFSASYPSYKGKVVSKKSILEKYKFAICYENMRDAPGYITEKIFDCFFAGCVPVYWGANNITDYIPENCFIDKCKFDTYQELYDFMVSMSDSDYMDYLDNIEKYIQSDQIKIFSADHFANVITTEILKDLN
jgi:hypothetical protein